MAGVVPVVWAWVADAGAVVGRGPRRDDASAWTEGEVRMSYLTVARLKGRPRDTQYMHAIVRAACPEGRPLWAEPEDGLMIIRSHRHIFLDPDQATVLLSRQEVDLPSTGATINFALIASPIKMLKESRRRVPLTPEEWEEWARRKLAGAVDVREVHSRRMGARVGRKVDGTKVTHVRVQFTGLGVVIDPALLASLASSGIGPGKAYGNGLLLVSEVAA